MGEALFAIFRPRTASPYKARAPLRDFSTSDDLFLDRTAPLERRFAPHLFRLGFEAPLERRFAPHLFRLGFEAVRGRSGRQRGCKCKVLGTDRPSKIGPQTGPNECVSVRKVLELGFSTSDDLTATLEGRFAPHLFRLGFEAVRGRSGRRRGCKCKVLGPDRPPIQTLLNLSKTFLKQHLNLIKLY